ncbi:MAG: hypothetical protein AB8H12_17410 [Lewinella sp.]
MGYDFDWQPIHREVLYEGDEGYIPDGDTSVWAFAPEYGAIEAEKLKGFPDIPYEIIDVMYIPPYTTMLTYTAFVISGNERFYEATDGFCHPDCPSWPSCLEDEKASICVPQNPNQVLESIQVKELQEKRNFPNYLMDTKMGYDGKVELMVCDIIVGQPNCGLNCTPVLEEIPHEPDACRWTCDCPDDDGGGNGDGGNDDDDGDGDGDDGGTGNGGDPPAGQVERCGCLVDDDQKKPAGRIILVDNQLGDEGIRRVKVKTTKYFWGFLWQNTNTDDEGCWQADRRTDARRIKVKLVFKDKVSDRMVIRSFRGIRFWNAFLKPVKHTFRMRSRTRTWNDLCIRVRDDSENTSQHEEAYVAAITNNGIHEYFDDYGTFPSPGKIAVLIHTLSDDLNSAPMFRNIDRNTVELADLTNYLLAFGTGSFAGGLYTYWDVAKPDLFLSFGDDKETDRKRKTVYHEMTHVSQFSRLGIPWWENYHSYIARVSLCIGCGQEKPYGNGDLLGHEHAELTEGMARSVDMWMSDLKYGLNHSNTDSPLGLNIQFVRYMNLAERLDFWNDETNFIPQGLFFDLFDVNNSFPAGVSRSEPSFVGSLDQVGSYSFEQQLNALNPAIVTIPDFQQNLFSSATPTTASTRGQFDNLFLTYGF